MSDIQIERDPDNPSNIALWNRHGVLKQSLEVRMDDGRLRVMNVVNGASIDNSTAINREGSTDGQVRSPWLYMPYCITKPVISALR